jgi:hypothetical protein
MSRNSAGSRLIKQGAFRLIVTNRSQAAMSSIWAEGDALPEPGVTGSSAEFRPSIIQ